MKRIVSSSLASLLLLGSLLIGGAYKAEAKTPLTYQSALANVDNGAEGEVVAVYQKIDGKLVKLTPEQVAKYAKKTKEVEKEKNADKASKKSKKDKVPVLGPIFTSWTDYEYDERGNDEVTYYKDQKRASNPYYNQTSKAVNHEFTVKAISKWTKNISLSSAALKKVTANVSVSWEKSLETNDTIKEEIRPGYTAWMEFVPFKYNTWGTLYEWEYKVYEGKDPQKTLEDVDEVDVYLPIENSRGEAEGMFILKEKKGEYTP